MSAKKHKPKTRKWITAIILVLAALGIIAYLFLRPVPLTYESVQAKTGDITTYYSFSGNVETQNRQTVLADRAMQISKVEVEDGDPVGEGDVLIRTTAGERIKAKIDGEAANLEVKEDEQVMAGAQLLEVVDYDNLEIDVKVDEYDIGVIAKGKEAKVKISATGQELKGTVTQVSKEGEVSNGVTYFTATIDLPKDSGLKIGMSAEITVVSDKAAGVVTLPMSAVQFDASNNPYVLKKGADGKPEKTGITTGINDGVTVEVKKGLSSGDTVLYEKPTATERMRFTNNGQNQDNGGD